MFSKGEQKVTKMKEHVIRLPRLYRISANLYKDVKEGASLKDIIYKAKHPNKKAIYAIVATTLQNDANIDYILRKSKFLKKESGIHVHVARVLIAELLWGKKHLSSECRPVQTVLSYHQIFRAHCSDTNTTNAKETPSHSKVCNPRFVRVNTLKLQMNEALDGFRDEGWTLKDCATEDYTEFLSNVNALTEEEFMIDINVKELLIFPPKTEFYRHVAYKCGQILLQDKASCLAVALLNPEPGSTVLDMCAAPGMKTTQIAAMLNNKGKIFAVDKHPQRIETLRSIVESAGVTCVQPILKDVLSVDGKSLPNVQYILLDPSCSGSGLIDRMEMDNTKNKVTTKERIKKLSGFQILALKHAMRRFKKVKRIVYSTCSLYPEENEAVVQDVISNNQHFKLVPAKTLVQSWHNFGDEKYPVGPHCIYSRPEHDLTIGFFVAVFEPLQEGEVNEFYNKENLDVQQLADNKKRKSTKTDEAAVEDTSAIKSKKKKKKITKS